MNSNEGWTKVVNVKKQKHRQRKKEMDCVNLRWEKLKLECPHIVVPERSYKLQKKLRIDKLEQRLLSDEFIEYQKQGWIYVKVMTPEDIQKNIPQDTEDTKYSTLSLGNKWSDCILFRMNKI